MNKEPVVFIEHILESIDAIEKFSKNINKQEFKSNRLRQSAIIREIQIIGEAVKNLPDSFREKYPEVPWAKIAGMRDKITHHYFSVDLKAVWKVVKEDLPDLKIKILKIKEDLEKGES